MSTVPATHERQAISLFQRDIVTRALIDSLKKLDPRVQVRPGSCSSWRSARSSRP